MIGRAGSEWSEGVKGLEGYRVVWGIALSGWNITRIYEGRWKSTRVALIGQDTERSDRMKPSCQKGARRWESAECNRAIALSGQRNAESSDSVECPVARRIIRGALTSRLVGRHQSQKYE